MNALDTQDLNFVGTVRGLTDQLLTLENAIREVEAQWLSQYSGRLSNTFLPGTPHEGLVKDDISAAVDILNQFSQWVDAVGPNRRGYLEKVRP
jgi:hypothetical protein